MIHKVKQTRHHKALKGAMMVEFAFIIPLYLTIIFAIFEAGRLIFNYHLLSAAVHDGVRWAAVRGSDTTVQTDPATKDQIQSKVAKYLWDFNFKNIPTSDVSCYHDAICKSSVCNTPGVAVEVLSVPDQDCCTTQCLAWTSENAQPLKYVRVFAQMAFEPVVPFTSVTLRRTATMQIHR